MSRVWCFPVPLCALSLSVAVPAPSRDSALLVLSRADTVQVPRNPRRLRAIQLLDRRPRGAPARVRFEWEQVAGVREYLLAGQWVTPPSWTINKREYRVNAHNASAWSAELVGFEASIPEGTHSWSVLSIIGKDSIGNRGRPTPFSFDIR